MTASIELLPLEIFHAVASYLSLRDLIRLRCCSQYTRNGVNSMTDPTTCHKLSCVQSKDAFVSTLVINVHNNLEDVIEIGLNHPRAYIPDTAWADACEVAIIMHHNSIAESIYKRSWFTNAVRVRSMDNNIQIPHELYVRFLMGAVDSCNVIVVRQLIVLRGNFPNPVQFDILRNIRRTIESKRGMFTEHSIIANVILNYVDNQINDGNGLFSWRTRRNIAEFIQNIPLDIAEIYNPPL